MVPAPSSIKTCSDVAYVTCICEKRVRIRLRVRDRVRVSLTQEGSYLNVLYSHVLHTLLRAGHETQIIACCS